MIHFNKIAYIIPIIIFSIRFICNNSNNTYQTKSKSNVKLNVGTLKNHLSTYLNIFVLNIELRINLFETN